MNHSSDIHILEISTRSMLFCSRNQVLWIVFLIRCEKEEKSSLSLKKRKSSLSLKKRKSSLSLKKRKSSLSLKKRKSSRPQARKLEHFLKLSLLPLQNPYWKKTWHFWAETDILDIFDEKWQNALLNHRFWIHAERNAFFVEFAIGEETDSELILQTADFPLRAFLFSSPFLQIPLTGDF